MPQPAHAAKAVATDVDSGFVVANGERRFEML